ncbi:hypothetical protein C1646_757498 [Rhizophagus diaphanus]|nr:hypothetical protein C1646_757498 [Rhizophagus diaphanus] [Rhizophagus sp. MUCL 43196]
MSAITTKFVTDHKLTNEMSLEELSQYSPEILELLTTGVPKDGSEAGEVNICSNKSACQVSDIIPEGETIGETAQRIIRDNLGVRDVKAIANAIAETASNPIANEFIPKPDKPLLLSYLHKLEAVYVVVSNGVKNLSEAMTIASQALRHSPDNHTSSAKN